jgi:hypothetical protein
MHAKGEKRALNLVLRTLFADMYFGRRILLLTLAKQSTKDKVQSSFYDSLCSWRLLAPWR